MQTLFQTRPALNTSDVDEARLRVGKVFCPHRLEPLDGDVSVRLRSAAVGAIGLNFLDYGGPVTIDPGRLGEFYLVQIPLSGQAFVSQNSDQVVSRAGYASVLSSGASVSMQWGRTNPQLIFYVSRPALECHLEQVLGRPVAMPVRFALGMDLTEGAGLAWWRAVTFLRDEIVYTSPALADRTTIKNLEYMLLSRLIAAQPHNYSQVISEVSPAVSRTVRQACALINDHLTEQLSPADVAEALQVSLRSLQEGFRRDLQSSLSSYIRDRRLDRAHRSLLAARSCTDSVTDIAMTLGITHLGRFSVQYKARFGQSPSETLAQK